jgi:NAD(P)-dependent dehydrogenase (short-subunit alcohol dehydrogenase family)
LLRYDSFDRSRNEVQRHLNWPVVFKETESMKVLIAGASGLVGSALIPALEAEGAEVTRLVRSPARAGEIEWHPNNDQIDAAGLEGFDAVINLARKAIQNPLPGPLLAHRKRPSAGTLPTVEHRAADAPQR